MTAVWAAALVAAFTATQDIDAFLQDFAKQRDAIETFQCRFTQITLSPDDAIESEGTLVFVRPRRILFLYDEPRLAYMIDQLTMYEYDADLEQVRIETLEDKPEADALFLGFEKDVGRLREAYDIVMATKEESHATGNVLKLTPKKREGEEPLFETVLLYLRDNDYLPYRLYIRNSAENDVTYELSDFVVNDKDARPPSTITVPEGTDVIRGDEKVETIGAGGKTFPEPAANSKE